MFLNWHPDHSLPVLKLIENSKIQCDLAYSRFAIRGPAYSRVMRELRFCRSQRLKGLFEEISVVFTQSSRFYQLSSSPNKIGLLLADCLSFPNNANGKAQPGNARYNLVKYITVCNIATLLLHQ